MPRIGRTLNGIQLVWVDIEILPDSRQYLQQWWEEKLPSSVKTAVSDLLTAAKISGYDLTQCSAEVIAADLIEVRNSYNSSHVFFRASLPELVEACQQWKLHEKAKDDFANARNK